MLASNPSHVGAAAPEVHVAIRSHQEGNNFLGQHASPGHGHMRGLGEVAANRTAVRPRAESDQVAGPNDARVGQQLMTELAQLMAIARQL